MTDEELLATLGTLAREDAEADPYDSRWDALAAGELSAEDQAALATLEAEDPGLTGALEAFAPREQAFDEHLADLITQTVEADQPTNVIAFPWRRTLVIGVPALLAAAAALFLYLRPGPTLPVYTVDGDGGAQVVRSDEGAPSYEYGPGSTIDLVVRPATDTKAPVAASVFVRSGVELAYLTTLSPTESGVFRFVGPVDTLLPAVAGAHSLQVVVGDPGDVPKTVDALRDGLKQSRPPWQVLQYPYRRVLLP